jgi:hypothetical protein
MSTAGKSLNDSATQDNIESIVNIVLDFLAKSSSQLLQGAGGRRGCFCVREQYSALYKCVSSLQGFPMTFVVEAKLFPEYKSALGSKLQQYDLKQQVLVLCHSRGDVGVTMTMNEHIGVRVLSVEGKKADETYILPAKKVSGETGIVCAVRPRPARASKVVVVPRCCIAR